eukprot:135793-Pyramimonas_sp.AAC.1
MHLHDVGIVCTEGAVARVTQLVHATHLEKQSDLACASNARHQTNNTTWPPQQCCRTAVDARSRSGRASARPPPR